MGFINVVLWLAMFVIALFLIVLVLIQRGRGGGLAGAFGGMGGQSAFGTKAGDLFTRVTIVVAAVWILLCTVAVKYYASSGSLLTGLGDSAPATQPGETGDDAAGDDDGDKTAAGNAEGTDSGAGDGGSDQPAERESDSSSP